MKPIKLIEDVEAEDRLLVCMLAAPDSEIDAMVSSLDALDHKAGRVFSVAAGEFLGLSENEPYYALKHYFPLVAKLRRQWAEAMIKEANGE